MNLLDMSFNPDTWETVGIVAAIFAGAAILIGALILIVGKVFKVNVDEKITKILENLAGANCGGCGCSGCAGFAQKLADGSGELSACHVTSPEKKAEIAKLLGIELSDEEPTVAIVKCHGGEANAAEAFEYGGSPTCAANATILGGNKVCKFACLGCGDCSAVCPEGAIIMDGKLSKVDPDRCVSCGACINACPKHVIERIPAKAPVYVACSSKCKGKDVMGACKVGCIACGMCAKKCPHGAITMVDNLPIIDYKKCTGCKTCVAACPRHIIIDRDKPLEEQVPTAPPKPAAKAEPKAEVKVEVKPAEAPKAEPAKVKPEAKTEPAPEVKPEKKSEE